MTQKKKTTAALITALVFAGLFLGNYGQFQLAAVPSLIYENYGLNDIQFSTVMTSPMVPAIFFSIVLGVLSDRFGIKKMGTICIVLGVVGYVLRWAFDGYAMLYAGMFLTGFLATVFNTNVSKIAASLYPPEKVGSIIGIFMAGSTGAMAFAYATTAMFPTLDAAFLFPVFAAALHLVLWVLCVRQKDLGETARPGEMEKGALMEALVAVGFEMSYVGLWVFPCSPSWAALWLSPIFRWCILPLPRAIPKLLRVPSEQF